MNVEFFACAKQHHMSLQEQDPVLGQTKYVDECRGSCVDSGCALLMCNEYCVGVWHT